MAKSREQDEWNRTIAREREYLETHPDIEQIPGAQELLDEALILITRDTRPDEILPRGVMTNNQIANLALSLLGEKRIDLRLELLRRLQGAIEFRKRPPVDSFELNLTYPDEDLFEDLDRRLDHAKHSRPAPTSDGENRAIQK